jgi:DNA polymerase
MARKKAPPSNRAARQETGPSPVGAVGAAARYLPEPLTLESAREAAASCRACELWKTGTQTVFGEGSRRARVMLVGEQPGHREDLEGHPFVGPAGGVLDRALEAAGIDRGKTYVTNVVKHFKWEPRGKVRLHKKPNSKEIVACRPWLEAEIELVKPRVLVALGATAAQALLGAGFRVSREHGRFVPSPLAPYVTATVHPSSILRQRTDEERERAMASLIDDLRRVRDVLDHD